MASHPVKPIEVSAHIPAKPAVVLEFVADTRNDPLWCSNVETVEMLTTKPVGLGSKFRFHQHLDRPGGERMQFDVDVEMTHRDDTSVGWTVNDRFQERRITLTVTPDGDGTRITQRTEASFHRPPGVTGWIYRQLAKRIFKGQFKDLAARFSESS